MAGEFLDQPTTELVLRRAFELESRVPPEPSFDLDRASLAAVAAEVGLPAHAVATALAEQQLVPTRLTVLDRVIGPQTIVVYRPSQVSEDEMRDRAQRWLDGGHGLRSRRRPDGAVVATKRSDLVGRIGRTVRDATGTGRLGTLRRVEFVALDIGDTPGAAALSADVGDGRAASMAVGGATTVGAGIAVGIGVVVGGPIVWVAAPVAPMIGTVVARTLHGRRIRALVDDLEETLDDINEHAAPPSALSRVRNRLGRSRRDVPDATPPPDRAVP